MIGRLAKSVPRKLLTLYQQAFGRAPKLSDAPEGVRHLTFKSEHYSVG